MAIIGFGIAGHSVVNLTCCGYHSPAGEEPGRAGLAAKRFWQRLRDPWPLHIGWSRWTQDDIDAAVTKHLAMMAAAQWDGEFHRDPHLVSPR